MVSFCLFLSSQSFAQIKGNVSDARTGEPLIGVNINILNNESVGTITDFDGNFEVSASVGDSLQFSYVGYSEQILPVSSDMMVMLIESTELLQEVVVIGYGAVTKKDLTGVVTKINEKDFNNGSLTAPEQLLNGKVAGLQINSNGEPGGGSRIRLRGGTSLNASSDPLIVIDGVPVETRGLASSRNPLNFVNAADIASMTILRDASAAAIYGARGANGVIIITTKEGTSGGLKIDYTGNFNISRFTGGTSNLSTSNFRNAILAKAPQEFEFLGDSDTDWVDAVLQNAQGTEHNLSFSGGSSNVKYRLSAGYLDRRGVINTSKHDAQSLSANVSASLFNNKLRVAIHSKTGLTNDRFAPGVIGAALAFDPTRPILDEDSEFGGYFQWDDPLATDNPVSTLDLTNETGSTTRLLNSIKFDYDLPFMDGLTVTSNVSYDYVTGDKRNFKDPLMKSGSNFANGGFLFFEDLRNYTSQIETYATYKKNVTDKSRLELVFGHSWLETDQENRWEQGNSLQFDDNNGYIYTQDILQDSFLTANRLISFFGRANYTINEKYLITASVRRDGSSRFGANNQWGLFPSFAVGWRILEEDFAKGLSNTFDNLKLRLSYGITGQQEIGDFLYSTFYSYGTQDATYQFGDQFVPTLRGVGVDPNIKWEETASLNFGIDFGLMNNRLSGSLEIYQKNTQDLLFTVAAPAFTNLSDRILTNIGEMTNKGFELTLDIAAIDRDEFSFNMSFNVSHNSNRIEKLDNSTDPNSFGYEDGGISGDVGQTIRVLRVGESIETFLTYTHILDNNGNPLPDGIDHDGDGFASLLDIYEDINEDGIINENDLVVNKTAAPAVMLGLTTDFSWKDWDLSATFRSHIGNYVYNNVASSTGFFQRLNDRTTNNIDISAFDFDFTQRQLKSNVYIENASFVRLDNITLGRNFSSVGILNNFRLFATVTNVFVFSGYSGLDPELPQFTGGIDNNPFPVSRNYLLGLNINF